MVNAPSLWYTYWDDPESVLELQIKVYTPPDVIASGQSSMYYIAEFTNKDIAKCTLDGALFDGASVGNVCSSRLNFTLKGVADSVSIFKKGQYVTFKCRLRLGNAVTAWVDQGSYYIQSVSPRENGDVVIGAYDELYVIGDYVSQTSNGMPFANYMTRLYQMYGLIAQRSDLNNASLYDGNVSVSGISIKAGAGEVEARNVLKSVAALAGGNIAINKSNRIGLYRLDEGPTVTDSPAGEVVTVASLFRDDKPTVVTGVNLESDNGSFKSSSGWLVTCKTEDKVIGSGSADLAAAAYRNLKANNLNIRISNVDADGAYITPLIELGDMVSVKLADGRYYNFKLAEYSLNYAGGCWGHIGIPVASDDITQIINSTWDATDGWIKDFTLTYSASALSGKELEIPNKYQFVFPSLYTGSSTKDVNVAYLTNVDRVNGTITYMGEGSDGNPIEKSFTVNSSKLATSLYPIEKTARDASNPTERPYFFIKNVAYFCPNIPDDAVGAQIVSQNLAPTVADGGSANYIVKMGK